MKIWHKIILVLCLLAAASGILVYDAYFAAPSRFTVRYETLSSVYIPEQMDDVNILYFSDLDYNHFMDQERMTSLVSLINDLAPDAVIFGGDLFDQASDPIDDTVIEELTSLLSSINAPLGKFAVLGDFDHQSDERLSTVRQILYDADFEVLENESVSLRNEGSQSVTIVGLDSGLGGNVNTDAAYASVSRTAYTIAVCHTPDTADDVPSDITNYFLAGHSHGGQVYYFFGAMYTPEMASKYLRGKHTISGRFTLDISNGVGTTEKDVRFLSNAEVIVYRLNHKAVTDASAQ